MRSVRALAIGAIALTLAVYLLRLNGVAGMYVDDAWYVLLAVALATGQGFHLISAPSPELAAILPASPPGLPLVLAPLVTLLPAFPGNVLALKAVSIAAMLGVGLIAARYFRDQALPAPLSMALAAAVVLTPAFVWLATSTVMSEPLFTLAQLSAVVLVARGRPVLGGAATAAAVLIRSAGLPLLAAGALWHLARREWRAAALYVATTLVLLLPWAVYARAHATPLELRLAHGGAHVFTYSEQFWMRRAGDSQSGRIAVADLPGRVAEALVDIVARDTGAIILPALYRPPIESGEETLSVGGQRTTLSVGSMGNTAGTMIVSGALSLLALAGFVARWRRGPDPADWLVPLALVPVLLFPHWAFRLVLPLTPFLYACLVAGVQALTPAWPRLTRIALACILTLHVSDHALYRAQLPQAVWLQDAREVDEVLDWMARELTGPGHVASTNPALIYLRTGRRGVAIDDARGRWEAWRTLGVRYVVSLRGGALPDPALSYRVLLRTSRSGLWIIEMDGAGGDPGSSS